MNQSAAHVLLMANRLKVRALVVEFVAINMVRFKTVRGLVDYPVHHYGKFLFSDMLTNRSVRIANVVIAPLIVCDQLVMAITDLRKFALS
jgi:hypothetical protein